MATDQLLLYLDFDGVLHHENCLWSSTRGPYLDAPERYALFQHAPLLEQLLAPYPGVRIVLSTSWVVRYGIDASLARMTPGLQARVIGATFRPEAHALDEFLSWSRGHQIYADAHWRQHARWLALDDDANGWPLGHTHRLVQTDHYEGIRMPSVRSQIETKLKAMAIDIGSANSRSGHA